MLRAETKLCKEGNFELYAGRFDEEFVIKVNGIDLFWGHRKKILQFLNYIKEHCYFRGGDQSRIMLGINKETVDKFIEKITNYTCSPWW